jgi:hypothetical protein
MLRSNQSASVCCLSSVRLTKKRNVNTACVSLYFTGTVQYCSLRQYMECVQSFACKYDCRIKQKNDFNVSPLITLARPFLSVAYSFFSRKISYWVVKRLHVAIATIMVDSFHSPCCEDCAAKCMWNCGTQIHIQAHDLIKFRGSVFWVKVNGDCGALDIISSEENIRFELRQLLVTMRLKKRIAQIQND